MSHSITNCAQCGAGVDALLQCVKGCRYEWVDGVGLVDREKRRASNRAKRARKKS